VSDLIQAVLSGKSLGYEYTEDILTSAVFGTLKYLSPNTILIPFLESAFLYNDERTTLWCTMKNQGIDLRCYQRVDYKFWAWNSKLGEPDLILIFNDHIHKEEDLLILVEVKFKSGKSGTNENDQLARYYKAISSGIDEFSDQMISGYSGKKGFVIYLTEADAHNDILDSNHKIKEFDEGFDSVYHLKWHQLYRVLENRKKYAAEFEDSIINELMAFLNKLGLRDFSGISVPSDDLIKLISSLDSVFLFSSNIDENNGYFVNLSQQEFLLDKKIFYGGNQNE
jgi:hypothetical protein